MSKEYRQWVRQYQDEAWSMARYLLGDGVEAEDATQEAFTSLWQHRTAIEPERARAWLMKATRNECFDRLRRRRPVAVLDEGITGENDGPVSASEQAELSRWLAHAVATLEEPYRSLVVLRDIQQYSYEDVAAVMNLKLTQVKVYLHRARKQLRTLLKEVKP